MKDLYVQIREQSRHITATPQHGTWPRIDAKLEAYQSRRKLRLSRLLAVAAVLAGAVALSVSFLHLSTPNETQRAAAYRATLQELHTVEVQSEAIFSVENIRRSYTDLVLQDMRR